MMLRPFASVVAVLIATACCSAQMVVSADKSTGIYNVGDTVHWSIEWQGPDAPPAARYLLKSGGLTEIQSGDLQFAGKIATLRSTFDSPNTILLTVTWEPPFGPELMAEGQNRAHRVSAGAVAAPDQIQPAAPPPDDFDDFWQAKLAELHRIPPNPVLEPADSPTPDVDYWKITLDNIRGTHIHGQHARPQAGDKLPALLILQYAGVYPLQKDWVTQHAARGWLALNIIAHDLPIDESDAFYQQQRTGPLSNYWAIGNDDPHTSYYLRMYLSGVQAVEYLKSRPDWNGKTLVVMGGSQGGQQTLAVAGLCPDDVTAAVPFMPAAADSLGPSIGRAAGFPNWYFQTEGKDPQKVHDASRYYDPINFAGRIKCPVLSGVGLHDDLAPPSSIFAAFNQTTSRKYILILSKAGHMNFDGSHDLYYRLQEYALESWRRGNLPRIFWRSRHNGYPMNTNPDPPADQPAPQNNPLFHAAHRMLLEKAKTGRIDVYFLGDSITRRFQSTDYNYHPIWTKNFFGWNAADFGWGGDSTQNVLYRITHGELDGVHPKVIVLMVGTNNVGNLMRPEDSASVANVTRGIKAILDVCRQKAPDAKIILTAITPRNDVLEDPLAMMSTINKINANIAQFADGTNIRFVNINDKLADETGKLYNGMTEDRLHFADPAYQIWADALKPILTKWLGPPADTDLAPPASGVPTPE